MATAVEAAPFLVGKEEAQVAGTAPRTGIRAQRYIDHWLWTRC